jgi:hypothetical protein
MELPEASDTGIAHRRTGQKGCIICVSMLVGSQLKEFLAECVIVRIILKTDLGIIYGVSTGTERRKPHGRRKWRGREVTLRCDCTLHEQYSIREDPAVHAVA